LTGRRRLRELAGWWLGLSLLFALVAAEGAFMDALAYWLLHIGGGLITLMAVGLAAGRLGLVRQALWLQLLVTGVVGAAVFTPLAIAFEVVFPTIGSEALQDDWATGPFPWREVLEEFLGLTPAFVATWALVNVQALREATQKQEEAREPRPARTGLLGKLPPALGTRVIKLSADLNYLEVTTDRGDTTVLYSLSAAAEELADLGIRVHRSHWIAKSAVVRVRRAKQGVICELENGAEVPVSRRRQRELLEEFGADFRRGG
ncbi:MAG: LytTR family DNA-binding domain-containing protein, partial [Pseudomonadota bacterium]